MRDVHLLPQYDRYVVGAFPRDQLSAYGTPDAVRRGTIAPCAVLLLDGIVGGSCERLAIALACSNRKLLAIRVHAGKPLSATEPAEVGREVMRVGHILEMPTTVEFGPIEPRPHL